MSSLLNSAEETNSLDRRLSDNANKLGSSYPWLITSSVIASFGADEDVAIPLYLTVGLVGTFFSWSLISNYLTVDGSTKNILRNFGNLGLDMVMVWVLTCSIESTIKLIVQRPRPQKRTKAALPGDIYSFPSGHSMRGFYYYLPYLFRSRYVQVVISIQPSFLLCSIALTGFSRVARLRHWPSDVVVGGAIGCVFGLGFEQLDQPLRLYAITAAVLWSIAVAFLQYLEGARRLFQTTEASSEWSAFVIGVLLCFWLYVDVSVQSTV